MLERTPRAHDVLEQIRRIATELEQRADDVESAPPGATRLIALGRLLMPLTALYRADVRRAVWALIDVAQKNHDITWADIANLFVINQIPFSESQIRQATMIRKGTQGSQTRRRREIDDLLHPEALRRWAAEGLTGTAISREVGVTPDTVRRRARKHGIELGPRRGVR